MRKILKLAAGLTVFCAVLALSAVAQATVVRYMSQHPLPRKMGGGFCYIDVSHVHDFGPSDPRMYRQVDGQYYFVGDPSPFSYEGPRHAYYGPHPIVEANVQFGRPEYCYLQGPHYHWYQPPPQASFELRGGAYWYTGTYEPVYYEQRPRYAVVNEAYAPIVYTRPVVDISVAPPGFHGEIVGGGPGWRGGVVVAAPPPPVVQVGVGINLGGPVVVEHDDGRHRGWERHERGGWRGGPPPAHGGGWRGNPAPAHDGGWRGNPAPAHGGGWRGNPAPQQGGWRGSPAAPQQGGWRGGPAPQQGGGRGSPAAPQQGGWRGGPAPQQGGGSHGGGKPSHGGGWKR
jgi:hypothetical protein